VIQDLPGAKIQEGAGKIIQSPSLDVKQILSEFEQLGKQARGSFLRILAHSLTVDARAILFDRHEIDANLAQAAQINEFLHQLTGYIKPWYYRSASEEISLIQAIRESSRVHGLESAFARALGVASENAIPKRRRFAMEEAARLVCDAAAEAVHRYAEISGLSPREDLTESFVVNFVFDELGDLLPMTAETNLRKLWRWHLDHTHTRWSREKEDQELPVITSELGQRLVDLVLYTGTSPEPSDSEFLGLVEFKLWTRSLPDREKLLNVLDHIRSCPNGALCSIIVDREEVKRAESEGWYIAPVRRLPHKISGSYFACIQHFRARWFDQK
jgi:hypothetical protein